MKSYVYRAYKNGKSCFTYGNTSESKAIADAKAEAFRAENDFDSIELVNTIANLVSAANV